MEGEVGFYTACVVLKFASGLIPLGRMLKD